MDWIVAIGIFVAGGLISGLVSYGWHKREHEVLRKDIESLQCTTESHDKRLDSQDIWRSAVSTQLDYIVKKLDKIDDRLEIPSKGSP